jgi:predicted component of type VI protein secretion system
MSVLIFVIGALLGVVLGAAICVRYIRQELTARIGPTMELLRLQVENLQSAVNIALANWHAELHGHQQPPVPRDEYERERRLQDRSF